MVGLAEAGAKPLRQRFRFVPACGDASHLVSGASATINWPGKLPGDTLGSIEDALPSTRRAVGGEGVDHLGSA
jgi:hypothetical protein